MTRRSTASSPRNGGFSLSEMLAVMAIMGLFILFGGPAMADAYRAYKVRSAADVLVTDIRALRYNAVAQRATQTLTINTQSNVSAPNQYTFVNKLGQTVTRAEEVGVKIDDTSSTTISFNNTGATGTTGNLTVIMSLDVNSDRGDRYTLTVTPTGTVSSAYSSYVP
jgi:prepilin-type N-terminal cleavage/methylation domain-containing protein